MKAPTLRLCPQLKEDSLVCVAKKATKTRSTFSEEPRKTRWTASEAKKVSICSTWSSKICQYGLRGRAGAPLFGCCNPPS